MTKDTDLLPCPFCGAKGASAQMSEFEVAWVRCDDCGAMGPDDPDGGDTTKAIRLWNTRSRPSGGRTIEIVFDGPPGPVPGRFVEVESPPGTSISFGEWVERDNGWWALRFTEPARPSGLALEWCKTTDRSDADYLLVGGVIFAGHVTDVYHGWTAAHYVRGSWVWLFDESEEPFQTKEAAQAAVERAVRSALGVEDGPVGEGWAVFEDGRPVVNTIAYTRRAAIVNWLVVSKKVLILRSYADETIEDRWREWKGAATVGKVGFLPLPNTEGNDG